jgi:FkbM family methyltransferase
MGKSWFKAFINTVLRSMKMQLISDWEINELVNSSSESGHYISRRLDWIQKKNISVVFDVGANEGQYAHELFEAGYGGSVVSFEPLSDAFSSLKNRAQAIPNWKVVNVALGENEDFSLINVSGNSQSSSLLFMLGRHEESCPESKCYRQEKIRVERLSSYWTQHCENDDSVWLKIDVQGFELSVLKGAGDFLKKAAAIELELSLVPLYKGQPLMGEMIKFLNENGFSLVAVQEIFSDPETRETLQMDGIFLRP